MIAEITFLPEGVTQLVKFDTEICLHGIYLAKKAEMPEQTDFPREKAIITVIENQKVIQNFPKSYRIPNL